MHTHKMRGTLKIVSARIQRTTRGHHIPLCINRNTFQLMHKIDREEPVDAHKGRMSTAGMSEMERARGKCRLQIDI